MEFLRFGLIVTGDGEAKFLPNLFRSIMAAASCTFVVIRKSEQLSPITSAKRSIRMVGRGEIIPSIDEEQYGIPARRFLQQQANSFVLIIDDLEGARRVQVDAVFNRYRLALDTMLNPCGLANRASVHFLVNMLEAYYFANCDAVNVVAEAEIIAQDHPNDVEQIGHPKSQLKRLWNKFHEIDHGEAIIARLDVNHVLQHHDRCCWLRTLFRWCISQIPHASIWDNELPQRFEQPHLLPSKPVVRDIRLWGHMRLHRTATDGFAALP